MLCSRLKQMGEERGLLSRFRAYGFRDAGVFLDWASIFQKDPKVFDATETPDTFPGAEREAFIAQLHAGTKYYGGEAYESSRSLEEKAAFGRALKETMDLWYGHAGTTVVLLTELPNVDELPEGFDRTRTYESRGWTTFERCSAELGKRTTSRWRLVIDTRVQHGSTRRLPTTPDMMAKLLKTLKFTNGADRDAVLALYEKTATAILGGIKALDVSGMQLALDDEWHSPQRLARALGFCDGLERLSLTATGLKDEHLKALESNLPPGSLPRLTTMELRLNPFGAEGIKAIGGILTAGSAPALRLLDLLGMKQADSVAVALMDVLVTVPRSNHPRLISLMGSNVGSAGALAVAAAITTTGSTTRFLLTLNQVPLHARVALVRARDSNEKGSRSDFLEMLMSQLGNALLPSILYRGLFTTLRRRIEREGQVVKEMPLHMTLRRSSDTRERGAKLMQLMATVHVEDSSRKRSSLMGALATFQRASVGLRASVSKLAGDAHAEQGSPTGSPRNSWFASRNSHIHA